MQGKYDRNIEDLDRARIDDARYWGPRYSETIPTQFGIPSVFGQVDPWIMQQRMLQQAFPQMQNPTPQYPSQFFPGLTQPYALPSYAQNIPVQNPLIPQVQPGFSTYVHPSLQPFLQTQFGFYPQHIFQQPYLSQQVPVPQLTQWPVQSVVNPQLIDGVWGEYPERKWETLSQRALMGRIPSRAFQRPPRNFRRSDELIRDEICKRLALIPEVDATDVEVIVRDGEITLRGVVDDRFEKRLVEDIVENTFGVRDLLNEIRVGIRQQEQEFTGAHSKVKEK